MPRFTDRELAAFMIDPYRDGAWAQCPFCPGVVVVGHRKGSGKQCLAHTAYPDPTQPGAFVAGCDRFVNVATTRPLEFLALLRAVPAEWHRLTG